MFPSQQHSACVRAPHLAIRGDEESPALNTLRDIDAHWRSRLASNDCPPLLGLAPLNNEECAVLTATVGAALRLQVPSPSHRVQGIGWLLNGYPAAVAVWLSRLAGDAYDGNFWDRFSDKLGCVDVPSEWREWLARLFRKACRQTMANFVEPEIGSRKNVDEFLFQAGLPLCHCQTFVTAMRGAAEAYGLPDPDDREALEDLRLEMLKRTEVRMVPVVKKALGSRSGLFLLSTAVRVVQEDGFSAINPQLGQKLRESFATTTTARGVAVRWPWLRLEEDLTSFAIVGPRQSGALLAGSGVRWVVNGGLHRVGAQDDFIFPISSEERVHIEMLGLASGRPLQRDFVLHPGAESVAAFVFSDGERRRLRIAVEKTCQLDAGDYWLVHPAEFTLDNAVSHSWPVSSAGMQPLATSRLELRPSHSVILRDGWGEPLCEFRAAVRPYIEVEGRRVFDTDEQCIHYGWSALPRVWIPSEEQVDSWELHAGIGGTTHVLPLAAASTDDEGTSRPVAAVESEGLLPSLAAGLHAFRLEAFRNGRRVAERTLWFWKGLEAVDGVGFHCSSLPRNLAEPELRGFAADGKIVRHLDDTLRQHFLAFRVGDEIREFRWRRPGVFLESFDKVPGRPAQPREHRLGETFTAATDGHRWVRLWQVPSCDSAVLVNGNEVFRFRAESERQFIDLSLAQLAAEYDVGGKIALRSSELETTMARFVRPLVPVIVNYLAGGGYETLLCKFNNPVECVGIRLRELASRKDLRFPQRVFSTSGHVIFKEPGLPAIEVSNITTGGTCDGNLHRVELNVPQDGWPPGFWLIELEVARDETCAVLPLLNSFGGRLPIVLHRASLRDDSASYRVRCFSAVLAPYTPGTDNYFPSATGHEAELPGLLAEVRRCLALRFEGAAWERMLPLKILADKLAKQARWFVGNEPDAVLPGLVEQLAEDAAALGPHSLFVQVPDLLALPSDMGRSLPGSNPVCGALRWAADLAATDRVANGLRRVRLDDPFGLADPSPEAPVLREFANSKTVLGLGAPPDNEDDLQDFKFIAWFNRMARDTHGQFDVVLDDAEALGPEHWSWAMQRFLQRRQRVGEANHWEEVAAVFAHNKVSWLSDLRASCASISYVFPAALGGNVWWDCEEDGDFLTGELARFSATLALGARTAARRWGLSFWSVLKPLRSQHGPKAVHKAITTLLTQAPEMLGFHLMFWELILRTYPHD